MQSSLLVACFGLALIAIAWLYVTRQVALDRAAEVERVHRENDALARTFEEHVRRVFRTADTVLLFLKQEHEKHGRVTEAMVDFVSRSMSDSSLNQIAVVNAGGDLVLSAVPPKKAINVSRNEAFRTHAESDAAGLHVGKPILTQVAGTWSFMLTRRLNRADGSFAGSVAVALDPAYFSDYYDELEFGADRGVLLVGRDGIVRARRFLQQTQVGQDLSASPLFARIATEPVGHYEVVGSIDQQRRFVSYRALPDYPLVVAVSDLTASALAPFERHGAAARRSALFFSVFVALFCAALIVAGRRERRQGVLLHETAERYRDLFENANDAIFLLDDQHRYLDANRRASELFGYTREEFLGRRVAEFLPPEQLPRSEAVFGELVRAGKYDKFEGRFRAKDGRWLDIEVNSSAILRNGRFAGSRDIVRDSTERTVAQQALRDSEERFQLAMRGANDGLWDWDLATDEVYYSPRWKSMLGYGTEELENRLDTWKRLVHPDDRERTLAAVGALLEGRADKYEVEFRMQHKDGSFRHILSRAFLFDDAAGNRRRLVGTHVDITERKRAQEEGDRLLEAISVATEGIAITDDQDRFVFVNAAHARIYGRLPDEFKGKSWRDTVPPDLIPLIAGDLAQTLHNRAVGLWKGECPAVRKDGTSLSTEITATARWDETGAYLGHICIVRDITERKRVEEKIRQSEQFIRSILDTVDEGFIVVDRDYHILTANKAYCAQAGRPCEEVIGRRCHEVSHQTNRPCFDHGEECAVKRVFDTGQPCAAVHKHPGTDGQVLFVETKAFPIKDAAGAVTSVIETLNNITEKHLLEEARLKTQKLESIGTLAGGIAHDFNNLLQGIFGYISMAKLSIDRRDRTLAMIEQAEQALHQAVGLTTQLLTFSRGGKPVREPIALQPVIENAVKFALSGSRAEYRLALDPGLWRVDGDAGQLSQVIQNIAMNADQAMPLGGCVEIAARNVPASDPGLPRGLARRDHVLIAISDSGVGIPERDLERVFDPYFTTKAKGSGLGLATSYSIVKNHDGRIFAESEVGSGSRFVVYLPASETPEAEAKSEAAAVGARPARILVMDDERIIRDVAGELLNVLGHTVTAVDRGEAAIEAFRAARAAARPFDVVILDLTIRGGMGGVATVGKLREIDPGVKAVASSGYSDDATLADHRSQGFAAFLKKPYDIRALQATLSALLA